MKIPSTTVLANSYEPVDWPWPVRVAKRHRFPVFPKELETL